jgi:hypothetical protein
VLIMRVLICGGRAYGATPIQTPRGGETEAIVRATAERERLSEILNEFHAKEHFSAIICGNEGSAERLATQWANRNHIEIVVIHAGRQRKGLDAIPQRNERLLREGKPDMIVAFPGGEMTRHMIDLAKSANIPVRLIDGA